MLKKLSLGLLFSFFVLLNQIRANSLEYQDNRAGISFSGSRGFTEQIADIMARPPIVNNWAAQQKQAVRPKLPIQGRENLAQHPRSAQFETDFLKLMAHEDERRQITRTVQTIGLNFLAAHYSESGFVPPDADGAVGP